MSKIISIQLGMPPAYPHTINVHMSDGSAEIIEIPKKVHERLQSLGMNREG